MNGKLVFGQYYNHPSWLHRLDPRTKLITIFIVMVSIFLLDNIYLLLGGLASILAIIVSTRIPLSKFFSSLRMMTMLLIFTVGFQIVFNRQGQLLREYYFTIDPINIIIILFILILYYFIKKQLKFKTTLLFLVIFLVFYIQTAINFDNFQFLSKDIIKYSIKFYDEGLYTSLKIVLRIISLIFISSLLTLSTKPTELTNGLESVCKPLKYLGVKVSILAMMISIALRFIPTLINEADKILKAQASRGVDFKEGKFKDKITQIISLLIPMFVIAHNRAYDLAEAMEARGYIPGDIRSNINELRYSFKDYFTLFVTVVILLAIIVLKVLGYAL